MKTFVYILMFIPLFSCEKKEHKLDWLVGNWERTNNSKGTKTFENWSKKSDSEYVGFGFTLKKKDTIFKEKITILKINNVWNYKVIGVNKTPTLFRFTNESATSFSCENKENEFPKKITYTLNDSILEATISDENKQVKFLFKLN